MNPAELREARLLDRLLDTLLDLPEVERRKRLSQLQATRPQIARKLERLVALAEGEVAALQPAGALKAGMLDGLVDDDFLQLVAGDVFCGYTIEALVGSGGMSNVYRARRDYEDFATTVALKLIRSRNGSMIESDTLRVEQRALARLEHPGIARFIDAGEGPDGELFIVMEYVDGEPILDHADRMRLDLRQRTELLIALCNSLEHAHARRLVHGDVKSANVLVDRDQRLRLVDFGIASDALSDDVGTVRAFTPECAAPEQVSGQGITTATDVFQVGALAYRLLGGCSRLQTRGASADNPESLLAPSAMLTRLPPAQANEAAMQRRLSNGNQLQRALRGDLDSIILRCLQSDPSLRYASILLLKQDLQACLDGKPVTARPPQIGYRIGKWMNRHRTVSALGAILILSALIFTVVVVVQALRLADARDRAQQEATAANAVLDYMLTMFRAADPARAQGREVSAREMLDLGSAALQDRFADHPERRERVLRVLGEAYESLGRYQEAEQHYAEARTLVEKLTEIAQRNVRLETESLLARLSIRQRRVDEAKSRLEAILAEATGKDEFDRRLRLNALSNLAGVYAIMGARKEAIVMSRKILAERRQWDGVKHQNTLQAANNHAAFLSTSDERAELEEALATMAEVMRYAPASLGENSPATLDYHAHYATLASKLHNDIASAELLGSALQRLKGVLGDRHPKVFLTWRNYALALDRAGESSRARTELEKLVLHAEDVLPATNSDLGFALLSLSVIQAREGDEDLAAENLVRALHTPINTANVRSSIELRPLLQRADVEAALFASESPTREK